MMDETSISMPEMDTKYLASEIGKSDLRRASGSQPESPETFQVATGDSAYVATGLSRVLGDNNTDEDDKSVFIVARGATGKSALAQYLSKQTGAPLWNTSVDKTIGAFSLRMHLVDYLMEIRPQTVIAEMENPVVIIDAVDEAQVRVSSQSWEEFKENVLSFAKAGVKFIVLGRENALWDIMASFEDADLSHVCYEILPFSEQQQADFVDSRYKESASKPESMESEAYRNARDMLLVQVRDLDSVGGDQGRFSGYAPVLEALTATLAGEANIAKFESELKNRESAPAESLTDIVEFILKREQRKFASSFDWMDEYAEDYFNVDEQIHCLLHLNRLTSQVPVPAGVLEGDKDRYLEAREKQLADHPFIVGGGSNEWASKVFEAYSVVRASDYISPRKSLVETGYKNPYVYIFWADRSRNADPSCDILLDEWCISAIHASRVSAYDSRLSERNSQTRALISPYSSQTGRPLDFGGGTHNSYEYVVETIREGSRADSEVRRTVFKFTTSRSHELRMYGPLANLTILSPTGSVRLESLERSPFLGPNFGVMANSFTIASTEVRLPVKWKQLETDSRESPAAMIYGHTVEVPLPAVYGFDRRNSQRPVVQVWDDTTLAYPWNLFRSGSSLEGEEGKVEWIPTHEKVHRLVAELRILRAKVKRSSTVGMARTAWCARVGLPRDGGNTNRILDILRDHGVVRLENELVIYTDNAESRPIFATPFDSVFGASPQFEELSAEARSNWQAVLAPIEAELGGF